MRLFFVSLLALFSACGGSGGSSDGTVIQGTLTERGIGHISTEEVSLKHSATEPLEDVKVCILGACSITDGLGQWGLNIDEFPGGDVPVVVEGHGINASVTVSVPVSARDVEMSLGHKANVITVERLIIDGEQAP